MKKYAPFLLALATGAVLAGCSGQKTAETTAPSEAVESSAASASETSESAESASESESQESAETTDSADGIVRVGSLKGPTSMGLVHLMDENENGEAGRNYEFTMVTAADELLGKIASGDLDIALIPANTASVLYNKTKGGISVIDINTLGVLDVVASDDSIQSIADLKGKTIYMTGKGTTPDYVFHYLLSANGLSDSDVTLEFKSEPAEISAVLKENADAIGVLPQPFVTATCMQNETLKIVLDLTEQWQNVQGENGSQLVTGVTVVRTPFLEEHPEEVETFLNDHSASAAFANENPDETADLIVNAGIIEKAPVAQKALPFCNITCLTGEEMKTALSGYLQVLYDQDPTSVGGALPADDFYYLSKQN